MNKIYSVSKRVIRFLTGCFLLLAISSCGDASEDSKGDVNVKGHYKKDGTYVKPHTRSAPRKKG